MDYSQLIAIGNIYVSTALLRERFVCDVTACRGLCCVIGDTGAPLEVEEIDILQREYESFAPYMTERGRSAIATQGVALCDTDGEWITPLAEGKECAYARFDKDGACRCAIEYAFFAGKTTFRKPVSCWLYPIRIQPLSTGCALNYHQWHLCTGACARGRRENIPVYRFLKEPMIAKFGAAFYEQIEEAAMRLELRVL